MNIKRVHCPNCGSYAEQYSESHLLRTECLRCDYLIICSISGNVIEAYAPGLSLNRAVTLAKSQHDIPEII